VQGRLPRRRAASGDPREPIRLKNQQLPKFVHRTMILQKSVAIAAMRINWAWQKFDCFLFLG
jgi:hypothetical protein